MPKTYITKENETLASIADRFGLPSWKYLYELNKDVIGDNPDILNAGAELQIPVLEESLGYQLLRGICIHAEEIKPILGLVKTQNIVYILRWYTISWYAYDVTVFWNSL